MDPRVYAESILSSFSFLFFLFRSFILGLSIILAHSSFLILSKDLAHSNPLVLLYPGGSLFLLGTFIPSWLIKIA